MARLDRIQNRKVLVHGDLNPRDVEEIMNPRESDLRVDAFEHRAKHAIPTETQ